MVGNRFYVLKLFLILIESFNHVSWNISALYHSDLENDNVLVRRFLRLVTFCTWPLCCNITASKLQKVVSWEVAIHVVKKILKSRIQWDQSLSWCELSNENHFKQHSMIASYIKPSVEQTAQHFNILVIINYINNQKYCNCK